MEEKKELTRHIEKDLTQPIWKHGRWVPPGLRTSKEQTKGRPTRKTDA